MLSDAHAAWVATALALCLKTEQNRRWSNSGTNEDHNTHTKISW